ncbi:carbohydrate ABC transporter permease [Butyrivibrio sp. MC2013]|uniref:carbohydrate ABC transporter permease n=1 Tax=Butyrivibrio sp. MC2013 TaxID=1280686 RepID=UPI00041BBB6B|nr:carbohydrate ABC transporter permease [Butyrivibrio sp. MC2013]
MRRKYDVVDYVIILILTLLSLIMIYPFWHEMMYSLSDPVKAASGGMFAVPKGLNLKSYWSVLRNKSVWTGFRVSVIVTLVGTVMGVLVSAMLAYPLSKKDMPGRKFFIGMIFFTMLFGGGMIPNYLLVKELHLIDSYGALILPGLLSAWNIFILKNSFAGIPASLEESARIDGANDLTIFFRIVMPLSKAVLATIALFTAVGYWNDYFSTILYIISKDHWSLQAVLREILSNAQSAMSSSGISVRAEEAISSETVKAATVMVATVPILMVYPFVQKYFIKGVLIGSVKG